MDSVKYEKIKIKQIIKSQANKINNKMNNINEQEKILSRDHSARLFPPSDRFVFVYITCLLLGISGLFYWNIFMNVTDYFVEFKLKLISQKFKDNFLYITSSISMVVNVLVNICNLFLEVDCIKTRIPFTLFTISILLIYQLFLAYLDSESWSITFFVLTLLTVCFMSYLAGLMNSCNFYMASLLPYGYLNAVIIGTNLSGVFTTMMSIISKIYSTNLQTNAIIYFFLAFVVTVITFFSFLLMTRMEFFKYWENVQNFNTKENDQDVNEQGCGKNQKNRKTSIPYIKIINKGWLILFGLWLNYFITLTIFPIYQNDIQRISNNFIIPEKWYKDVLVYLTFNVSVTFGNIFAKYVKKPNLKIIVFSVILRSLLIIAFFLLCNYKPKKLIIDGNNDYLNDDINGTYFNYTINGTIFGYFNGTNNSIVPILITNDWVYWFGSAASAFSFGYLTSLLLNCIPLQVETKFIGIINMISSLIISIGILSGLQFIQFLKTFVF
jgi:equilibrative nucleoside transporter 1/2/3